MKTRDPSAMRHEYVVVDDCSCIRETSKAILVWHGDPYREVWIPQSLIHDDSECYEMGTEGALIIPRWLAEDKELEYRERTEAP